MSKSASLILGLALGPALALSLGTSPAAAADTQYHMQVDGMTCPFCVATSEQAMRKIKGVNAVSADLKAGLINVCTDGSVHFTDDQLKKIFLKEGFTYRKMTKHETCSADDVSDVMETKAK